MQALAVQLGHRPQYDLAEIGRAGFSAVKIVLMADTEDWSLSEYISDVHAHGLAAWGIVARESCGALDFKAAAAHYASAAARLDYLTVGNENDGKPDENPMSWCLGVSECARLLRVFRAAWTSPTELYAIGTVRGDGEYVRRLLEFDPGCLAGYSCLDVHAYAQDVGSVGGMLNNYWAAGLPLVVGEYGTPDANPAVRGRFARDMARRFDELGIRAASLYCWSLDQGEDFGINVPAALPFIRELGYGPGAVPQPIPEVPPVPDPNDAPIIETGITLPDGSWVGPGVAMYIRAHGLTPVGGEEYFGARASMTPCAEGMVLWIAAEGRARFVAWTAAA
jgi:hypothetical protein